MLTEDKDRLDGLRTYIDGKMKRYNLLFAVNGGAFAIAKLLTEPQNAPVLGGLSLQALAIGASLFTGLMCIDIWFWGTLMRESYFGGKDIFGRPGKIILSALGALLVLGWLLAAFGRA
jgi:hypothetical protein